MNSKLLKVYLSRTYFKSEKFGICPYNFFKYAIGNLILVGILFRIDKPIRIPINSNHK